MTTLLEPIGTYRLERQRAFQASAFFREKNQPDGIRFWFDPDFRTHFLDRIETGVKAGRLNIYRLRESSTDDPILSALGDKTQATSLAYVAQLIKAQPNGEEGVLLTNGWANVFYVEDAGRVLWAVDCLWDSDGREWGLLAHSVSDPREWHRGCQVFSPAVPSEPVVSETPQTLDISVPLPLEITINGVTYVRK